MKLPKLLCVAALALPGLVCAVTDSLMDYRSIAYADERVPEIPQKDSSDSVREDPKDEWQLVGSGHLLFWKTRRGNLDYLVVDNGEDSATIYSGDVKNLELDYDLGWRADLAMDNQHWDFKASTIQFNSKKSTSRETKGDEEFFATRVNPDREANAANGNFEEASANFDVRLAVYDLTVGHSFRDTCDAVLHAFGGVRHARLEQEFNTRYADDDESTRVRESSDLTAWGLVGGVDVLWYMCSRLGVVARVGGSLMAGKSDSRVRERDYDDGDDLEDLNVDLKNKETRVVASIDLMAGLHFMLIDGEKIQLAVESGYEFMSFHNLADFPQSADDNVNAQLHRNVGVVGFDGAFLRIVGTF